MSRSTQAGNVGLISTPYFFSAFPSAIAFFPLEREVGAQVGKSGIWQGRKSQAVKSPTESSSGRRTNSYIHSDADADAGFRSDQSVPVRG